MCHCKQPLNRASAESRNVAEVLKELSSFHSPASRSGAPVRLLPCMVPRGGGAGGCRRRRPSEAPARCAGRDRQAGRPQALPRRETMRGREGRGGAPRQVSAGRIGGRFRPGDFPLASERLSPITEDKRQNPVPAHRYRPCPSFLRGQVPGREQPLALSLHSLLTGFRPMMAQTPFPGGLLAASSTLYPAPSVPGKCPGVSRLCLTHRSSAAHWAPRVPAPLPPAAPSPAPPPGHCLPLLATQTSVSPTLLCPLKAACRGGDPPLCSKLLPVQQGLHMSSGRWGPSSHHGGMQTQGDCRLWVVTR